MSIALNYLDVGVYLLQQLSVVQSLSCVQLFAIPRTAARQASLSFTVSQSLLKFMSMYSIVRKYKEVIKAVYLSAC